MGLLSRARDATLRHSSDSEEPDELLRKSAGFSTDDDIERSCIEQLRRLEHGVGTTYTALTVFRAYFPTNSALVYRKKDGAFLLADTVGVEEKSCPPVESVLTLPSDAHVSTEGYYKLPTSVLCVECCRNATVAYAFPIPANAAAPFGFLVIVSDNEEPATLASIRRVIDACPKSFIGEASALSTRHTAPSVPPESEETAVRDGLGTTGKAQILVFKLGKEDARLTTTIVDLSRARLGSLGIALYLGPNRLAVFLKENLDRELYSHLLQKTFRKDLSLAEDDLAIASEGRAESASEALAILRKSR